MGGGRRARREAWRASPISALAAFGGCSFNTTTLLPSLRTAANAVGVASPVPAGHQARRPRRVSPPAAWPLRPRRRRLGLREQGLVDAADTPIVVEQRSENQAQVGFVVYHAF